jgi:hypothetical protein
MLIPSVAARGSGCAVVTAPEPTPVCIGGLEAPQDRAPLS